MRKFIKIYFCFLILFPFVGYSQVNDSFEMNAIDSSVWQGDLDDFRIDDGKLRLSAQSDKRSSYLYSKVANIPIESQWNIDVSLNFNPSNQNYLNVWLVADTLDVKNADGVFITIGENGSDDALTINQRENGEEFIIGIGKTGNVADKPNVNIAVKRSLEGTSQLSATYENGLSETIDFSVDPLMSFYFIIECHYTSTRADKFLFDNIYIGPEIVDLNPPILSGFVVDDSFISLIFNEDIDATKISNENFAFSPSLEIERLEFFQPNAVKVIVADPFETAQAFSLEVKTISDLSGNLLDTTFHFSVLQKAGERDLLVNEILFNPRGSGSDYVEIVNNTEQTISLEDIYLGNTDNEQKVKLINPQAILPNEILAFVEDKENVISEYRSHSESQIFEQDLPSFNNDNGNVTIGRIVNGNLLAIDGYDYSEKDHLILLDDEDGVSLERIDLNSPTEDNSNWTSAASTVGFGTPGLINSAFQDRTSVPQNLVAVTNKVFSPNQDGYDDYASFTYNLSEGFIGNATVFDISGREIKKIWNNESLSSRGEIIWDGTGPQGSIASEGIYVILFELFSLNGDVIRQKEDVVLVAR